MTPIAPEELRVKHGGGTQDVDALEIANETKDLVLAAIGHDLWSPLTVIAGFAETLRRDAKSKTQREALTRIVSNAERIEKMLRRMLAVSEDLKVMGAPGWNRVDLASVVTDVIRRAHAHTQLSHVDVKPAFVDGNAALLDRLVESLVANAFRHTPPNTEVWIRVRAADGTASIVVEDSGPGLPTDLRMATTFDAEAEGRPAPGMGLFLADRIARLHGGRFRLGERPRGGARFVVELPEKRDVRSV